MSKEKERAEETKEQFEKRSEPPKKDTCGTCVFYQNERAKSYGTFTCDFVPVHLFWYWGGCCLAQPGDEVEIKRDRTKCKFYEGKPK